MPDLRRSFTSSPRWRFVGGLLVLTLVLAGVLAYEAQKAVRSHRTAATSALRDHATFVAWQYADRAQSKLDHYVIAPGLWYARSVQEKGTVGAGELEMPASAPEGRPDFVRRHFRFDLAGGQLEFLGDSNGDSAGSPPAYAEWLADTLAVHARTVYRPAWAHATLAGSVGGRTRVFYYTLERDVTGAPCLARGFETDPAGLKHPFEVAGDYPLLPPSLTNRAPNQELLSVHVLGPRDDTLYASLGSYASEFTATETLSGQFGGFPVEVTLRPEIAETLLIGGLPSSRVPFLVGLFLLAGLLVAAAIVLLRREVEFADLRTEFVSNVSHELRTPLAQIRMFAETLLLDRVRSGEERRRGLEIIDQEARRLTTLVGNILLFSRAERGVTRLHPEPTDPADLLREVLDTFGPLARTNGTVLETDVEEGVVADVDPSALRQIVLNFLDNAVKYGPEGQTVRVGMRRLGETVRIWVDDQGPGVPPEERERVWKAFSRLESARATAAAGTGIGLSVVRDLVDRHDGRTWIGDAPEGGARFVVELPVGRTAADARPQMGAAEDVRIPVEVP